MLTIKVDEDELKSCLFSQMECRNKLEVFYKGHNNACTDSEPESESETCELLDQMKGKHFIMLNKVDPHDELLFKLIDK